MVEFLLTTTATAEIDWEGIELNIVQQDKMPGCRIPHNISTAVVLGLEALVITMQTWLSVI